MSNLIQSTIPSKQHGFGLMEVLIALILGLLTTLVISQVTGAFEGQKRSTMSGGDAQTTGATALYFIERDMRNAGYGFAIPAVMGCDIKGNYNGTAFNWKLAPVQITDGSATGSSSLDELTIFGSSRAEFSLPMTAKGEVVPNGLVKVDSAFGVTNNDLLVVWGAARPNCTLIQATKVCDSNAIAKDAACKTLPANPSGKPDFHIFQDTASKWNASVSQAFPAGNFLRGAVLFNLGSIQRITYKVNNSSLLRSEYDSSTNTNVDRVIMDHVVNLQARYGFDTNGDGVIDNWSVSTPSSAAIWQTLGAIRIVVVARSNQYEQKVVTGMAPLSPWPTWSDGAAIDVNFDADAEHYRYRTFETVIPLRNRIWGLP
ncbi:type IV pilus assembly protein PilW [Chitinivorax tropicus]|uniref:Type IV pilus assembly protein PilW n=1 Tax=Chitinivorax tropicus TaxID=714531 RepID=A0A840MU21_9PROT|nr:PilW family protein [Chitinivorax tropicus]MBB5019803.1 type IV pilus assembly protein PilW [Chitinivorax tropicus]